MPTDTDRPKYGPRYADHLIDDLLERVRELEAALKGHRVLDQTYALQAAEAERDAATARADAAEKDNAALRSEKDELNKRWKAYTDFQEVRLNCQRESAKEAIALLVPARQWAAAWKASAKEWRSDSAYVRECYDNIKQELADATARADAAEARADLEEQRAAEMGNALNAEAHAHEETRALLREMLAAVEYGRTVFTPESQQEGRYVFEGSVGDRIATIIELMFRKIDGIRAHLDTPAPAPGRYRYEPAKPPETYLNCIYRGDELVAMLTNGQDGPSFAAALNKETPDESNTSMI